MRVCRDVDRIRELALREVLPGPLAKMASETDAAGITIEPGEIRDFFEEIRSTGIEDDECIPVFLHNADCVLVSWIAWVILSRRSDNIGKRVS